MTLEAPTHGRFVAGEHRLALRVYYEDTDAAGIVYYANYLKFAERARSEFLRAAGIDQRAMREEAGLVFAVRHVEVDYREPARLDDALEVRSRLIEVGGASVVAEQVVERAGRRLVRLVVKVACITLADGRPARMPAAVRAVLAPYCGHNQQAE